MTTGTDAAEVSGMKNLSPRARAAEKLYRDWLAERGHKGMEPQVSHETELVGPVTAGGVWVEALDRFIRFWFCEEDTFEGLDRVLRSATREVVARDARREAG